MSLPLDWDHTRRVDNETVGVLGYFLGRHKDKQNVTVEIPQPDSFGVR